MKAHIAPNADERNFVHSVDSTYQNYLKKMKEMKANDNLSWDDVKRGSTDAV